MFREICKFEDVISSIALERIIFTYNKGYEGNYIDGDSLYQNAVEIVYSFAREGVFIEYTESTMFFFQFPEMDEFYDLCKEHSRRNQINFLKDPYITAAKKFVLGAIENSGMYNISEAYWIPPKLRKKRYHQFLIELGCLFNEWVELVGALFEIRAYFAEKVGKLKAELYPKPQILVLPAVETDERKAA